MAEDAGEEVVLHVYDLSAGLATQLSNALLGKQVDGVWHTGIIYKGTEYYYGAGIQASPAGATPFGKPLEVISLGRTQVPEEVFHDYLADMRSVWTAEAYSLFENNCNNFSDEVAHFLTGSGIPSYITDLPREVLATPFGQMLAPGLRNVQGTLNSVQQQPSEAPTPFKNRSASVTDSISDSLRAAAAAVVADTGIPLDAAASRRLAPQQKEESMKRLAEANHELAVNPQAKAEVASGLGRTSIGREHRELLGSTVASTMGFPAPVSRRLTTAQSGEIITRLGSGLLPAPQPSLRPRPESAKPAGDLPRRLTSNRSVSPPEPKDGTKAQPGPSSAKIQGLNAGVAYTMERSNSGRTAASKAAFEAAVRREFARIMAEGGCSPNEAAAQAISRAATTGPSAA